MRRKHVWIAIVASLGLAFGQQAIARTASIDVEITPGVKSWSNLGVASQAISIDGVGQASFPTETVQLRGLTGLEYSFGVSADSADGPSTGSIFGTQFNVSNNGTDSLSVRIEFRPTGDAVGRDAFSNNQIQYSCIGACVPELGSLTFSPNLLGETYKEALEAAGLPADTIPRFESINEAYDTRGGRTFFSGMTGKLDVGFSQDLVTGFSTRLPPGARFLAGLDASSTAIQSTAMANGRFTITVAAVPEPAEFAMLLAGLGVLGFAVRRRMFVSGMQGHRSRMGEGRCTPYHG